MGICDRIYERWMGEVQRRKIEFLLSAVRPGGLVLDVGAGPGFLSEYIPVVSVDVSEAVLSAKGYRVIGSGNRLPFKTGTFDFVFCLDAFHFLSGAGELERVLKHGGKLVISQFTTRYDEGKTLYEIEKTLESTRPVDRFFLRDPEPEVVLVAEKFK